MSLVCSTSFFFRCWNFFFSPRSSTTTTNDSLFIDEFSIMITLFCWIVLTPTGRERGQQNWQDCACIDRWSCNIFGQLDSMSDSWTDRRTDGWIDQQWQRWRSETRAYVWQCVLIDGSEWSHVHACVGVVSECTLTHTCIHQWQEVRDDREHRRWMRVYECIVMIARVIIQRWEYLDESRRKDVIDDGVMQSHRYALAQYVCSVMNQMKNLMYAWWWWRRKCR